MFPLTAGLGADVPSPILLEAFSSIFHALERYSYIRAPSSIRMNLRSYQLAQDFTPVQDRAELKRLLGNAVVVNATEGFKQDAETDALDALFIELGVQLGAIMDGLHLF